MPASTNKYFLIADANPRSQVAETFRTLRTNIQFSAVDTPLKTILVTSAQPEDGKSTTVANLAVSYAQEGRRVLLVDADLRRPTLHRFFGKSNRMGLTNLLTNDAADAVLETHVDNLFLLASGPIPPNPAELLASQKMTQLLERLSGQFDVILIDSPPLLAVTDAQIMSAKCDGVVLVIGYGRVKRDTARKMLAHLEHAKARVLGVVLNNKTSKKGDSSYYYYYGVDA